MRKGKGSTEWWLSSAAMVLAVIVSILIGSGVFPEGSAMAGVLTAVSASLAAMGYSVSRGMVKSSEAKKEALIEASKKPPGESP